METQSLSTLLHIVTLVLASRAITHGAELPAPVRAAQQRLEAADNYRWTRTIDMKGAPESIAAMTGQSASNLLSVIDWTLDGKAVQAARRSGKVAVNSGKGWISAGDALKSSGGSELAEVLGTQSPTEELKELLPLLGVLTVGADGSYSATMAPESARSLMMKASEHRTMKPTVTKITGRFQLWLRDGLPVKYMLTIDASMSMLLMHKDIQRVQTVELSSFGTTKVLLPAGAKAIIGGP